jgi:hypothetical protein
LPWLLLNPLPSSLTSSVPLRALHFLLQDTFPDYREKLFPSSLMSCLSCGSTVMDSQLCPLHRKDMPGTRRQKTDGTANTMCGQIVPVNIMAGNRTQFKWVKCRDSN